MDILIELLCMLFMFIIYCFTENILITFLAFLCSLMILEITRRVYEKKQEPYHALPHPLIVEITSLIHQHTKDIPKTLMTLLCLLIALKIIENLYRFIKK